MTLGGVNVTPREKVIVALALSLGALVTLWPAVAILTGVLPWTLAVASQSAAVTLA